MKIKFDLVNLEVFIHNKSLPWYLKQIGVENIGKYVSGKQIEQLTEEQKKELVKLCFYEESDAAGELYNMDNAKIVLK